MNKTLHVFVYLFLILVGAGLFFEYQLHGKRMLLKDRNRLQEDYITKLASTIECVEPSNKDEVATIEKDVSPVEAKIVDSPDMDNLLQDYKFYLEQENLKTYEWVKNEAVIEQLRAVYALDGEGKVRMDGDRPIDEGPGTERELLEKLYKSSQDQHERLDNTRAALKTLHGKLADVVDELNKLKQEDRQDKVTIVERDEKIAQLEAEKADLESQVVKLKANIEELNAEITSLRDDLAASREETAIAKEELTKAQDQIEKLKKLLAETRQSQTGLNRGDVAAVAAIPFGDKGKIVMADNTNMFAIVEFTPEAMKQLKGDNNDRPLPFIELGVKRAGFQGEAGEFVGRIRLRQEVAGKNYIVCDILKNWEQDKVKANDTVFSD